MPRCAFCTRTTELAACEWPDLKFVLATYADLEIGDRVRRAIDQRGARPPAVVAELTPLLGPGFVIVVLAIRDRHKTIQVCLDSIVRVERPAACGELCCERHRVERGPGAIYCWNHMRSWEAVA
jgi:hypothetical protein